MESDLSKDWEMLRHAVAEHYSQESYLWKGSDEGQSKARSDYLYNRFKPTSVVELGAGRFNIVKYLQDRGCNAVGLDISPVAGIFIKGNKVQGVIASVSHMPFKNDAFDLVIGFDILEHQPSKLCKLAIEEVKRISKKFIAMNIPMGSGSESDPNEFHHPSANMTRQWWLQQFSGCRDLGIPKECGSFGFANGMEPCLIFLEKKS